MLSLTMTDISETDSLTYFLNRMKVIVQNKIKTHELFRPGTSNVPKKEVGNRSFTALWSPLRLPAYLQAYPRCLPHHPPRHHIFPPPLHHFLHHLSSQQSFHPLLMITSSSLFLTLSKPSPITTISSSLFIKPIFFSIITQPPLNYSNVPFLPPVSSTSTTMTSSSFITMSSSIPHHNHVLFIISHIYQILRHHDNFFIILCQTHNIFRHLHSAPLFHVHAHHLFNACIPFCIFKKDVLFKVLKK